MPPQALSAWNQAVSGPSLLCPAGMSADIQQGMHRQVRVVEISRVIAAGGAAEHCGVPASCHQHARQLRCLPIIACTALSPQPHFVHSPTLPSTGLSGAAPQAERLLERPRAVAGAPPQCTQRACRADRCGRGALSQGCCGQQGRGARRVNQTQRQLERIQLGATVRQPKRAQHAMWWTRHPFSSQFLLFDFIPLCPGLRPLSTIDVSLMHGVGWSAS